MFPFEATKVDFAFG